MAAEPWNVVNLPQPSAVSSCRIAFDATTADIIERLLSHEDNLLRLLCSELLHTELIILYEILYVVNNSLRQHIPFRALKQVEQCVNRLNEMNLQRVLTDLEELCPDKTQSDEGLEMGHCNVPSQPALEWLCLRLLGASQLLCRTLDQCSRAFLLTRQHMRLGEFVALNLVITSLLSRLWVFFRGILRALVPVYQWSMALCQAVALCQPMAYLKPFVLPADLDALLSPQHSALLREDDQTESLSLKQALKPSVIDIMFDEEEEEEEEMEMETLAGCDDMWSSETVKVKMATDVGTAVLRQGARYSSSSSGLDVKSMLRWTRNTKTSAPAAFVETAPAMDPDSEITKRKKTFSRLLKSASSFAELVVRLEWAGAWLRERKLHRERRRLAYLLLSCRRMSAAESYGSRTPKKLRKFRGTARHVILHAASSPRPPPTWRNGRTRFATLMARYGSARRRLGLVRTRSSVAKDLFGIAAKWAQKDKRITRIEPSPFRSDDVKEEVLDCDVPVATAEDKPDAKAAENNEIDNIFASLGF